MNRESEIPESCLLQLGEALVTDQGVWMEKRLRTLSTFLPGEVWVDDDFTS